MLSKLHFLSVVGKTSDMCYILQDVPNLGPATDFYKKLALDCSAQQIAVDLFMLNGQFADMASIGRSILLL